MSGDSDRRDWSWDSDGELDAGTTSRPAPSW